MLNAIAEESSFTIKINIAVAYHYQSQTVRGMMWCKFHKESFNSEKDVYLCICYVPPEDSSLYTNSKSDLYQLDFYEYISDEIRKHMDVGHVLLLGDFNARTGQEPDYVSDVNIDRFVDLPCEGLLNVSLPLRTSDDLV